MTRCASLSGGDPGSSKCRSSGSRSRSRSGSRGRNTRKNYKDLPRDTARKINDYDKWKYTIYQGKKEKEEKEKGFAGKLKAKTKTSSVRKRIEGAQKAAEILEKKL